MPQNTPNLNLVLFDELIDKPEHFLAYRLALAGTQATSNMNIIDDEVTGIKDNVTELKGVGWVDSTVHGNALQIEGLKEKDSYSVVPTGINSLLGTVSEITTIPNDMIIKLIPTAKNTGAVTLSINVETPLALVKVRNISGATAYAPLETGDLQPDMPVFITKSPTGSRYILVGFGQDFARNVFYEKEDGSFETVQENLRNLDVAEITPELTNLASIFNTGEGTEGSYVVEDSFLTDEKYEGLSIVNGIDDGDIATSATSSDAGSLFGVNTDGTWIKNNAYSATEQLLNQTIGDKWFHYFAVESGSVGTIKNQFRLKYSDESIDLFGAGDSNVKEFYGISTATKSLLANVKVREGTAGQVDRLHQMSISLENGLYTKLTSLGYTTDEQKEAVLLDIARQGYIDGLQGTGDKKVTSVGKNMFDDMNLENGTVSLVIGDLWDDVKVPSTTRVLNSQPFKVKSGEPVAYSFEESGIVVIAYHEIDSQNRVISQVIVNNSSGTFTPSNDKVTFLFKNIGNTDVSPQDLKDSGFQLEKGTVTTTYEKYDPSSKYLPELLSVPSADDTIEKINGVYYRVQRTLPYLLKDADLVSLGDNVTQFIRISLSAFIDLPTQTASIDGDFIGENLGGEITLANNGLELGFATSPPYLFLNVPLGTYATIADARTDLVTNKATKVFHAIETPIYTKLNLSPLNVKAGGTIFQTTEFEVLESYGNGIDVAYKGYSKVYVSEATHVTPDGEVVLDVSDFVVTGTDIANNNLSSSDLVYMSVGSEDGRTLMINKNTYAMNGKATSEALNQVVNAQAKTIDELEKKVAKSLTEQEPWVEATLLNGWTSYAGRTVAYYIDAFGEVHIKGTLTGGTTTANTVLFTLPEKYRPSHPRTFACTKATPYAHIPVSIVSTGDVTITDVGGAYVYLDGMSFRP